MIPTLLFAVVLVLSGLLVRHHSEDESVRRRAVLVVVLALTAVVVRVLLEGVPPTVPTTVTTTTGEQVQALTDNAAYEVARVVFLATALLALLLLLATLLVDLLLVRRLEVEVPLIVRDTGLAGLFFLGLLIILYYETDLDLTGLFTTAGVISVVIGLALQNTLDNVFSGLALQSEGPFGVGDWIEFEGREGVAANITWRSTMIRTRSNDLVIVPNSVVSKSLLVNHSAPSDLHAVTVPIGAHYRHPPAEVRAALEEVARQTAGVLRRPAVEVRTESYGDSAITYSVRFWIRGYADLPEIRSDFMTRVWYGFRRHGIEIPFPHRTVYKTEVTEEARVEEARREEGRVLQRLGQVELFESMPEQEMAKVAEHVRVMEYFTGETILWQGLEGGRLYVVDEGRVEVVLERDGRQERLAELGPGDFVGEMALMTGERHTATVVALEPTRCLCLDREGMRGSLERHPELAERITETLVRRRRELDETERHLEQAREPQAGTDEHRQILGRIRDFFGFGE